MNLHEIAERTLRRRQLQAELEEAVARNPWRAEQLASGRWHVIGRGGVCKIPRHGPYPEQERAEALAIDLNLEAIAGA